MTLPFDDDDSLRYPPTPVMPELFVDLDLQLFTATDEAARWAALVAGTREVLDRFAHLASPKVRVSTGPEVVLSRLDACVQGFAANGAEAFAQWLQTVVDVLDAHASLQRRCAQDIRAAGNDVEAAAAIIDAAGSINSAADATAEYVFAAFPPRPDGPPDYALMAQAGLCLAAETHRIPLRTQLDGAGGASGSAEFNPFVAALFRLELATHRRLYRLFYELCFHVGFDLHDNPDVRFDTPDGVDRQGL
ncbi:MULTISPECIES: hypothetical protein [unclassified Mycolicibacterium]|uniref:hypothetical protein n=1 Tax=unclassified Mycolicibacterium TaxID=2636767 RepID=UPI002EDA5936